MRKIVSALPANRFAKYGLTYPSNWDIVFGKERISTDELLELSKDAEVMIIGSPMAVPRTFMDQCPNLKFIQVEGVGFDKIDLEAAKEKGIIVCNNKGINKEAVAEHTVGLMLAGLRRTALDDRIYRRKGGAAASADHFAKGEWELYGKTVGMVGLGDIGKETVKRLANWGCDFLYYDILKQPQEVEEALNIKYAGLDELLASSDIVSLHVPVTSATAGMVNKDFLCKMKKNALLINTARGDLIDNEALAWALENDVIYGAALDVITPEPAPLDHVLLNMSDKAMDKIVFTPHAGGTTNEVFERMLVWSMDNVKKYLNGEEPLYIVNK